MTQPKSLRTLVKASKAASKNNYVESISLCKKAISQSTSNIPAYKLLATNLIALKRFDEVEVTLKKVIKLLSEEESYPLLHLLGCNYISQQNYHCALNTLEALFNKTGDSKVLLDIALSYFKLDNYEAAREIYLKVIELEPNNHQAKFNLYPILLHFRDYKNAWACFHSRLEREDIKNQVHWFGPEWNGESLIGKRILIYPEQGIGDNLAYAGCFSEAIRDAKQTYIACDNRLKELYKHNFPDAIILSYDDINKAQTINNPIDLQILAGSLPYLYRQTVDSFYRQQPLQISSRHVENVQEKLSDKPLRIGLSWFHGRFNDGNEYSMYLEELLPVLKIEGIEWVNLQFGKWQDEVKEVEEKYGISITHIEDCSAAGDFNHYGSLIANLDLVIASSNAALMFATRLGVKSWSFLPGKEQVIKIDSNEASLAKRNTRIFYRDLAKDWTSVVEKLCDEIKAFPELSIPKEDS